MWEVRSIDGRLLDIGQISAGEVNFKQNELIIESILSQYGTTKGRCIVIDRRTKEQYPSADFIFAVPPFFKPEDVDKKPAVTPDALR